MGTYPYLSCKGGKIGCSSCKEIEILGTSATKSTHLAIEWVECEIAEIRDKGYAQKSLRKKIAKHSQSQAHIVEVSALETHAKNPLEKVAALGVSISSEVTEKCLRTSYLIGYKSRPFSEYPD